MTKYLSLDTIETYNHPRPDILSGLKISMRGTKNLFNIFFSISDIETGFGIDIPSQVDYTWINTPSGRDKYISYPTMKRMLFQLRDQCYLVEPYLKWVDGLLFSNSKIKPFFRSVSSPIGRISSATTTDTTIDDDISDIDDSQSMNSYLSNNDVIEDSLRKQIIDLQHALELKNKDIDILHRDVQLRDKEIEILQMKVISLSNGSWI